MNSQLKCFRKVSGTAAVIEPLLAAMRQVESGGDDHAVGDGGRSKGPYQISRAYWIDGGGAPERYEIDVWDAEKCGAVIIDYWWRYANHAMHAAIDGDGSALQILARVHNGGPGGDKKPATRAYWLRVRAILKLEHRTANREPRTLNREPGALNPPVDRLAE
jgi:hypothetical protein